MMSLEVLLEIRSEMVLVLVLLQLLLLIGGMMLDDVVG